MKRFLCLHALVILVVATLPLSAQSKGDSATLLKTIASLDSRLFDAYNHCDLKTLGSMVSEDLEFYHDQTGLSVGKDPFLAAIKQNICGKVQRSLVSMEVYPLNGYGAVETGVHRFLHPWHPSDGVGEAKFVMLWQNKDGIWTVTRVISYNHEPVATSSGVAQAVGDTAEVHFRRSNELMDQGDRAGAIEELRAAIRLDPANAQAHNNLGLALYGSGDRAGGIAQYREALRLYPEEPNSRYALRKALDEEKWLDIIITRRQAAVRSNPNSAQAHFELGLALEERGKREEAQAEYGKALALDPRHADARAAVRRLRQ